jgi:hypothetical protein
MRLLLLSFFLILLISCKSDAHKNDLKIIDEVKPLVQSINNPVQVNSSLPRLFSSNDQLYMSWVEKTDSLSKLIFSIYEQATWTKPQEVVSGTDWFVNWADFPAIAQNNGNILTSFLQKSASGTYTYDVKLNLYNAAAKTWKKNFILHDDGTQSEHGFITIKPYVDNSFFVTWLDGRETVGKGHGGGQMMLRGAIVFEDGSVQYDTLLDDRTCDCCQTSAAIGPNNEIVVVYRDRSEDEIRDISVVRWEQKIDWSKPKTISNDYWKIPGCPVNGPSIDAFSTNMAVAWFTAANENPRVEVAFSKDIGETFDDPIRIDSGNATGRVDIVMISELEAAVLWMEPRGEEELLQIVKVASSGKVGERITIDTTSAERASGFPQLERLGETLIVAWTHETERGKTIKTAEVKLSNL